MKYATRCALSSGVFAIFFFVWAMLGVWQYSLGQNAAFAFTMTVAVLDLIVSIAWLVELNNEANRYYERDKQ